MNFILSHCYGLKYLKITILPPEGLITIKFIYFASPDIKYECARGTTPTLGDLQENGNAAAFVLFCSVVENAVVENAAGWSPTQIYHSLTSFFFFFGFSFIFLYFLKKTRSSTGCIYCNDSNDTFSIRV